MKDANRNYIAVGTFVLAMLTAVVLWFAALSGVAVSTDPYFILWDNVMGLKPGTQILFEGYQIGLIEKIERAPEADTGGPNYRVEIAVEKDWPIPVSAKAETTAPSFLAALVVNIEAGDSDQILAPGSVIRSKEREDLLGAAGSAMSKVSEVLEFVKPRIEEITNSISLILNEENAEQVQSMLETMSARIGEILSDENAENIGVILTNLSDVAQDMSDVTGGLQESKAQVDDILATIDGLIDSNSGDIGKSLADLQASLEAVARHIDEIASNLEDTTRNTKEFSEQIRSDPSVLLRGREAVDDGAR
ncbi:MAG: MCE family protein [Deltaproteobacteria bacterium]|jgi:phospholipid/cholesterol/gamma-HCH transport system substrate-binding protein|nr:MCE family protein [Deltaproteobacteria bacterium]MBW2509380.1 MCE family protein [Deltaproteobacteria bacterium]